MSDETTVPWRFAIGQQVRLQWEGRFPYTITARRWVERQHLPPYAAYYVQRETERLEGSWIVETELDATGEKEG